MKKPKKYLTQSEFAELAGITRAGVNYAIKTDLLDKVESGKIDIESIKAISYLKMQESKNRDRPQKKSKKKQEKLPGIVEEKLIRALVDGVNNSTTKKNGKHTNKYEAEVERITEQIRNLQIKNDALEKNSIPRPEIRKLFEKQSAIIISHFHPVGQRTAEIIAGLMDISEPEQVIKIEKIITDEIMKGILEYKKALVLG